MTQVADAPGRQRTLFFVGAGASLAEPSALPLFSHIRQAVLDGLDDALQTRLGAVAPEPLLRSLELAGVPVARILIESFDRIDPKPNAVHYVLAHRLLCGDHVWTTNYDTLIDDATHHLAASLPAHESAAGRYRQPHGRFIRGDGDNWTAAEGLIFHADQVVLDWEDPFKDELAMVADGARIVLVGYSGADVNSYRALRHALGLAREVCWYWFAADGDGESALRDVRFRFPELPLEAFRPSVNPSRAFVEDFGTALDLRALTPLEPAARTATVSAGTRVDLRPLTRHVAAPSVQAIIARELGERRAAARLLGAAVRDGLRSLRGLLLMLRHWPPVSGLRQFARVGIRRAPMWLPARDRVRARAIADLPLRDNRHGEALARRALYWAEHAKDRVARARLLLEASRVLRACGRHREAVEVAEQVLGIARDKVDPQPTEAARAAFEQVEALRTMGNFDRALEVMRLRLHTLGMSHWAAWLDYEHGCVLLQQWQLPAAAAYLGKARDFFDSIDADDPETAYDPTQGQVFCGLALAAVARCAGRLEDSRATMDAVRGHTRFRTAGPLLRSAAAFQSAELARTEADWDRARTEYRQMDPDLEIYGGLSSLGLALCAWGAGEHAVAEPLLDQADERFTAKDSWYGLAYSAVVRAAMLGAGAGHGVVHVGEVEALAGSLREWLAGRGKIDATVPVAFA